MDPAAGPRQLEPGSMLDDKYRIESLLAVGGMGAVYIGTHIRLRKRVAIKVLRALGSPAMVERFHREAITASQIGHEGIAQVTDIGTSSEGEPFLVMEYLEGESLAARLKASGPLPVEVACELGCSILAPLSAAHHAGIVHRDLKPDNVFLVRQSRDEMVKLLDFGISRSQGLDGEFRLTTTGLVLGTPYYMSPEQARGDTSIGTAADLYAFGVMLYEMLLGVVPIQGDNYNQLMYRVMTGDYVRPRVKRPDLPVELEQIIVQAMALEPADRPSSAALLEQSLLAFCRPTFREHTIERLSRPSLPLRQSVAQQPLPSGTDRTVFAGATVQQPQRSRALKVVLGLVVLGGLAGGAVAIGSGTGDDAADPPAATRAPAADPPAAPAPPPPPAVTPPTPARVDEPAPPAAPATITLKFVIDPTSAVIQLDGKPLSGTEIVVPKDTATHELAITAPGFASHVEQLAFEENQRLVIALKRSARTDKPPRPGRKTDKPTRPERPGRIDPESPY